MVLVKPTAALGGEFVLPEDLESASTELAEVPTASSVRPRRAFRVGDLQLALGENEVAELLEAPTVFAIPNSPNWVGGLVNVRGDLLPVIDLHRVFRIRDGEKPQHLLAVGKGDDRIVFGIDELPFLVQTDATRELERPPEIPRPLIECTEAIYEANGLYLYAFQHRSFVNQLRTQHA